MGRKGAPTATPSKPFSHAIHCGKAETRCLWLEVHYSSIEQGNPTLDRTPLQPRARTRAVVEPSRAQRAQRLTCARDESCPRIPLSKQSRIQCASPSFSEPQIHSRKLLRWRIVDELCCMANFAPLAKTFAARAIDFRPGRRRTRLASSLFRPACV
jgi:hypothetical protein